MFDERLLEAGIPSGIEIAEIVEERTGLHPFRHFLIFGDVADLRVGLAADLARVGAEDSGRAVRGGNEIHENFDRGGFPGAVLANEGVQGTLRNVQIDVIDSGQAAETLCQLLCVDG